MKITKDQFVAYIDAIRKAYKVDRHAKRLGIDLTTFLEAYEKWGVILYRAIFTEEQQNVIEWWLFDAPDGIVNVKAHHCKITDSKTLAIIAVPDTPEKLYDYLESL